MIVLGLGMLLIGTLFKCAVQRHFGRKGIRSALTLEFKAGDPYSGLSFLQLVGLLWVAAGILEPFLLQAPGVSSGAVRIGETFAMALIAYVIAWIAMRRK